MGNKQAIVPLEHIESRIYLIRREKVILDVDLAALYEVEVKALNQAVKRNIKRFPGDSGCGVEDRKRTAVAKTLLDYGSRVQYGKNKNQVPVEIFP